MKAMILAAGRGERMGELTQNTPKPLLKVAGHYLIEYPISHLQRAGITEIVINLFYQGDKIKTALGDGSRYGVSIIYSEEKEKLEVGGGIFQALPLLGDQPFIVVSADVITDYPLAKLLHTPKEWAHLVMVDNPPFNAQGDFGLEQGYVHAKALPRRNFAGIGVYTKALFVDCPSGYLRWSELMHKAIENHHVTGEYYQGKWYNLGTREDLQQADLRAREDSNLRPLASETNTLSN